MNLPGATQEVELAVSDTRNGERVIQELSITFRFRTQPVGRLEREVYDRVLALAAAVGQLDVTALPYRSRLDPARIDALRRSLRLERLLALRATHPGVLPAHIVDELEDPDSLPTLAEVKRAHVQRVLDATGGNKTRAARILGTSRKLDRRARETAEAATS